MYKRRMSILRLLQHPGRKQAKSVRQIRIKEGKQSVMDFLLGIGLVLGVMILVHEWGHFIVARLFGVRVEVFSIGFGPRLFGWKRGATDYRVSALPVGGYVRMAGQDPTDVDSADRDWVRMRSAQQGKTAGTFADPTNAAPQV